MGPSTTTNEVPGTVTVCVDTVDVVVVVVSDVEVVDVVVVEVVIVDVVIVEVIVTWTTFVLRLVLTEVDVNVATVAVTVTHGADVSMQEHSVLTKLDSSF